MLSGVVILADLEYSNEAANIEFSRQTHQITRTT